MKLFPDLTPELLLYYWRTASGIEVDFILGDMEVAIEIKASRRIHDSDGKGLRALASSHQVKRLLLIAFENEPKQLSGGIHYLPWETFIQMLWAGEIV